MAILNKPGRFTPDERTIMETHAAEGARLIREMTTGGAQMHIAEEIAHFHHEKYDGSGYPNKLKGNQIPLSARITALSDVFDALTHRRCYKEAWTHYRRTGRDSARARARTSTRNSPISS